MRTLIVVLAVSSATVLAEVPDAGSPACPQQVLSGLNAWQGRLSFTREKGALVLRYVGPEESEQGKHFAMKLSVSKKVLRVTIAASSVPDSPDGITLPAFGKNSGSVTVPALPPGAYVLELTQGASRARYELQLTDDVKLTPVGKVPDALAFSALEWRRTPPDAALISCAPRKACGNEVCQRLMRSELLRALPKVDDGAYFTLANSDTSCAVHLAPEREAEVRAQVLGLDDAGCARLWVRGADAGL